ncbi:MAG TPA: hypothetical protein VF549_08260 [Solirubrobacteraceae bacterium]|jgi:hypothetical protein
MSVIYQLPNRAGPRLFEAGPPLEQLSEHALADRFVIAGRSDLLESVAHALAEARLGGEIDRRLDLERGLTQSLASLEAFGSSNLLEDEVVRDRLAVGGGQA